MDKQKVWINSSLAYVEFDKLEEADDCVAKMNGGMIDGEEIRVTKVLPRQISPARNRGVGLGMGRMGRGGRDRGGGDRVQGRPWGSPERGFGGRDRGFGGGNRGFGGGNRNRSPMRRRSPP